MIGLITLNEKCAGARSAGNPHAACEAEGTGNGVTDHPTRARRGKPRIQPRAVLRATAPVLDPTGVLLGQKNGTPALYSSLRQRGVSTQIPQEAACFRPLRVASLPRCSQLSWNRVPATQSLSSGAVRPYPPLTEEKSPLAVLIRPPLTEESLPVAALFRPPLTEEWLLVAPLFRPPLTEEREPLAVLYAPPLTEDQLPLAVLLLPPLTEA